ncbi:ring finger domain-containing protein [Ditylenchus destructor]|nr:ring finger domain-containing protein [Ditylenchus destructor]
MAVPRLNSLGINFLPLFKLALRLIALFLCAGNGASAQFLVEVLESTPFSNHRPVVRCDATGANFGEDVMAFSFGLNAIGCAIRTIPEMACDNVVMPPINETGCSSNFAVVPRGNCSFSEKAYYVQFAHPIGYEALIMYNEPGQAPIPMSGSKFAEQIQIPVVMVNYACMESLMGTYSADKGYVVTLKASPGYYDLIKYLVPFVAIVGFCFIVLFISLVIRLCRERRRLARKRLSKSNLKKIPTRKYKKGDREETCAICLEDFVEGDKLRILPCRHAYHCKCVDPWLTKNRKVCPVCKRKVGPNNGGDSSDSDSERATTSAVVTPPMVTREQDSLLRNEQPMATSTSGEFPYPPVRPTIPMSNSGSFSRAASLLNLSNLFSAGRNGRMRPTSHTPSTNSREFLVASMELPNSSRSDSNLNNGDVEDQENHINENWAQRAKRKVARVVSALRDRNMSTGRHTQLLDEDDTATTVTRDELDTDASRQAYSIWAAENNAYDANSNSADGNSLTTVCSANNRHLVRVDVEPLDDSTFFPKPNATPPILSPNPSDVPNHRLNVVVFDENSPSPSNAATLPPELPQ